MDTINLFCENTSQYIKCAPGTSLLELASQVQHNCKYTPLAAIVDNTLKELTYKVYTSHTVKFIDFTHPDGRRTYIRSLSFLIQKSVADLFPDCNLRFKYTLPNGLYGEFEERDMTIEDIVKIKERMLHYIKLNLPFEKRKLPKDEAVSLFRANRAEAKAALAEGTGKFFITTYFLDGYADTFYGPLLTTTGCIDLFDIVPYDKGFCLQSPSSSQPWKVADYKYQDKLSNVFREHSNWNRLIGVDGLARVNKGIEVGKSKTIIQIAEALHERKYAEIANMIYRRRDKVKLVLIAGPSSSGKTTTSKRIALQCMTLGLNPLIIEMDNYFVNRDQTPRDENGDYDFESLQAMDLHFLNTQLNEIFSGKEVELPKFDFVKGERTFVGNKIQMKENDIIIMEGIHALNKELTNEIEEEKLFRVYASALTSLSIDENNVMSTTDNRLLRRMVRDYANRGVTPEDTILRWPSVRRGEERNIFPFQENADIMFNSTLFFELPLLKYFAEPLLNRISPNSPAYSESIRLLKFLSYITPLTPKEIEAIPPTSVMREFIGGSSFDY